MSNTMARRPKQLGFTLIELLIAMSIMGLLLVATMVAWRVGTSSHEKANRFVEMQQRQAAVEELIQNQIGDMVPVRPWMSIGRPQTFFYGNDQGMRFVSRYSLLARTRGGLVLAEYVVQQRQGQSRLLLRETALHSLRELDAQLVAGQFSRTDTDPKYLPLLVEDSAGTQGDGDWLVLIDHLKSCKVEYFVVPGIGKTGQWTGSWMGADGFLPHGIAIKAEPEEDRAEAGRLLIAAAVQNHSRITEYRLFYR
jgi:prepilin-type N-terminal cleavage/methylation domain-containing protein